MRWAPTDSIANLKGTWESMDNPVIEVFELPIGSFVAFGSSPAALSKIIVNDDGLPTVNGYTVQYATPAQVTWLREASGLLPEKEIVWSRRGGSGREGVCNQEQSG